MGDTVVDQDVWENDSSLIDKDVAVQCHRDGQVIATQRWDSNVAQGLRVSNSIRDHMILQYRSQRLGISASHNRSDRIEGIVDWNENCQVWKSDVESIGEPDRIHGTLEGGVATSSGVQGHGRIEG